MPLLVKRIPGSSTRLPTIVVRLSAAYDLEHLEDGHMRFVGEAKSQVQRTSVWVYERLRFGEVIELLSLYLQESQKDAEFLW
jgi:hypothetical protein